MQLNAQVDALRRECDLLREANAKISASAFNADREQEFREKERALRLQIAQLEATMKADLGERGSLLDRLTTEKSSFYFQFLQYAGISLRFSLDTKQKSEEEYRTMHLKYLEMKEKYDDLTEKMKFFERVSSDASFYQTRLSVYFMPFSGERYQYERNRGSIDYSSSTKTTTRAKLRLSAKG